MKVRRHISVNVDDKKDIFYRINIHVYTLHK